MPNRSDPFRPGVSLAGAATGLLVHLALAATSREVGAGIYLPFTNVSVAGLAAAWGLVLAGFLGGGAVVLSGLLLWGLGHLPWGAPGFLHGFGGRLCHALLPGPLSPEDPSALGYTSAATAGAVLLALALRRRRPA